MSANTGLDAENLTSPIDQLAAELFQDPTRSSASTAPT